MRMTQLMVKSHLKKALTQLYKVDHFLMRKDVGINERTVTHRLAVHLIPLFPGLDVDCEYNRMMQKNGTVTEGDYWAKTIALKPPSSVSAEDDEAVTVFPDIIIHQRGTAANYVVIEVKMKWKNKKKNFDLEKLKAYKEDLKYLHAVYLELGETDKDYLLSFE